MIQLVLGLLLLVSAFMAGMRVESNARDAAALQEERQAHAEKEAVARGIAQRNAGISATLEAERVARSDERRRFNKRLEAARHEGNLVTCSQQPSGGRGLGGSAPAVYFGSGFVGLWDDALKVGLPAALGAAGADGADPGPGVVTPEALLDNHAENAERANECRAIALGWQRWAREQGVAK